MTVKTLTVPRSSLISAAFRVLQVRDACGLVCLMRREIGTLGRLYARPFLLVTKTARRGSASHADMDDKRQALKATSKTNVKM